MVDLENKQHERDVRLVRIATRSCKHLHFGISNVHGVRALDD